MPGSSRANLLRNEHAELFSGYALRLQNRMRDVGRFLIAGSGDLEVSSDELYRWLFPALLGGTTIRRDKFFVLHTGRLKDWQGDDLRAYLRCQKEAISEGLLVHRIIFLTPADFANMRRTAMVETFVDMCRAGMTLTVTHENLLPEPTPGYERGRFNLAAYFKRGGESDAEALCFQYLYRRNRWPGEQPDKVVLSFGWLDQTRGLRCPPNLLVTALENAGLRLNTSSLLVSRTRRLSGVIYLRRGLHEEDARASIQKGLNSVERALSKDT